MKNITLSADEALIDAARERARAERSTLNGEFRRWLQSYAGLHTRMEEAASLLHELRKRARSGGRRFTREEMNER